MVHNLVTSALLLASVAVAVPTQHERPHSYNSTWHKDSPSPYDKYGAPETAPEQSNNAVSVLSAIQALEGKTGKCDVSNAKLEG